MGRNVLCGLLCVRFMFLICGRHLDYYVYELCWVGEGLVWCIVWGRFSWVVYDYVSFDFDWVILLVILVSLDGFLGWLVWGVFWTWFGMRGRVCRFVDAVCLILGLW